MSETIDLATVPTVTSLSGLSLIGLNGSGEMKKITPYSALTTGSITDLNELRTPGSYVASSQMSNTPSGDLNWRWIHIEVFSVGGDLYQRITQYSQGGMATRLYQPKYGKWQPWKVYTPS